MGFQDKVLPPQYHRLAYSILILSAIAAAVLIATLYLMEAIHDYKTEHRQLKSVLEADKSRHAIPRYIRVTERRDKLVVDELGNATLEWLFVVTGLDKSNTRSLELQIYSEHKQVDSKLPGDNFKSNIEIVEMKVAGQKIETASEAYTPLEIRYPIAGEHHPMEFGILRVPTDLSNIEALAPTEIRMTMRLKDTFFRAQKMDFFVVEIPQLTNKISVTLESKNQDYIVIVPPDAWDEKIKAQMGHSGTLDTAETLSQSDKVFQSSDGKLIWESEYPKLGYRYLLSFRLHRPGLADTGGLAKPRTPSSEKNRNINR